MTDPLDWPASPWDGASPESYLLLHFSRKPNRTQPLKLGLMKLVARKRLRLIEATRQRRFGRPKTDWALADCEARAEHAPALPDTLAVLSGSPAPHVLRSSVLRESIPVHPVPPCRFGTAISLCWARRRTTSSTERFASSMALMRCGPISDMHSWMSCAARPDMPE